MNKIGRNDPCHCGSGRKFKLCCGAVKVAVVASATSVSPSTAPSPGRQCGECTGCCEGWAEGEIRGHRMFAGQHCHFLREGACTIYDERPQSPCRNFVCGWLAQGSPLPEEFRPDRIGVIVVPTRWRSTIAYILLSAGRDPGDELLAWMREHSLATGRPFFFQQNGERFGFGPNEFLQEMMAKVQRGERLW